MINHILLICFSIFIYETLRYINFIAIIKSIINFYKKIFKLLKFENVSDLRKEKLIINYSRLLLRDSLKILLLIVFILITILTLNLLSNSYLNLIISILGIVELSIIFLAYHLIRKKFNEKL